MFWKISSSFQIYIHCVELEKLLLLLLLLSFVIVQFNQLLAGDFEKHFIAFPYGLATAAARCRRQPGGRRDVETLIILFKIYSKLLTKPH